METMDSVKGSWRCRTLRLSVGVANNNNNFPQIRSVGIIVYTKGKQEYSHIQEGSSRSALIVGGLTSAVALVSVSFSDLWSSVCLGLVLRAFPFRPVILREESFLKQPVIRNPVPFCVGTDIASCCKNVSSSPLH